jgi:hypothetical protein
VEFERQLPIGSLDFILRRSFGQAQDLIVVFFLKNFLAEFFLYRELAMGCYLLWGVGWGLFRHYYKFIKTKLVA